MDEQIAKTIELIRITCKAFFGTEIEASGSYHKDFNEIKIKILPMSEVKIRYVIGKNGATSQSLQNLINVWGIMQGYPKIRIFVANKP